MSFKFFTIFALKYLQISFFCFYYTFLVFLQHWFAVQAAAYQRKLLHVAVKLLKPGGHLVYSTCTINPGRPMSLVQDCSCSYRHWFRFLLIPALVYPCVFNVHRQPRYTHVLGEDCSCSYCHWFWFLSVTALVHPCVFNMHHQPRYTV